MTIRHLRPGDFRRMAHVSHLPRDLQRRVKEEDFRYRGLDKVATGEALRRGYDECQTVHGSTSREHWEAVWKTNAEKLVAQGQDPRAAPYLEQLPLRLSGRFIQPVTPGFERRWLSIFLEVLFRRYFRYFGILQVYEFGCGSGWNLALLKRVYPSVRLCGVDWSQAAVQSLSWVAQGWQGDMKDPATLPVLRPMSGVLTVGAMEQLGQDYLPFLEYLHRQKPAICLHLEPIMEWYQPLDSDVDALAVWHHTLRNYFRGFPALLDRWVEEGRAELLTSHRTGFGSFLIEGYSQVAWAPQ